jgi:hypothetical protein
MAHGFYKSVGRAPGRCVGVLGYADEVTLVVDVPPTEREMVKRLKQVAGEFVEPVAKL